MAEKDVRTGVEGFTDNKAEEVRRIPKRTEVSSVEREKDIDEMRRLARMMQVFPRTLPEALDTVMKEYDIRNKELAEESDIDVNTIKRIRNVMEYKPKLPTMIQLCIGLRVPTVICLALIEVSGYTLRFYGVELAYYYILTQKIGCTLYDCNQYLKDLGYSQLGETYIVA